MELTLRSIEPGDNPGMAAVIRTVMPEFGCDGPGFSIHDPEVDHMWEAYHGAGSSYWVITDGDRILGGAGYARLEGGDPHTCELKKMYFLPEARRKGFGALLMQRILRHAAEDGYRTVYIETVDRMRAANALYRQFGFKALDHPMGETGHGACDTYYARSIGPEENAA